MAGSSEPVESTELYVDGRIKFTGLLFGGEMHGDWSWYRTDGSLMRTGSFDRGRRVGTWRTYDRAGTMVKATSFPEPTDEPNGDRGTS